MHLNEGQIDWMERGGGRVRSLPSGPERRGGGYGGRDGVTRPHSPLSINEMIGHMYAEPRPHLMEQLQ